MPNKDLVLGIDIGGTKTAFGFVDIKGKLICATTIPTQPHESAQTLVSRLHQRIEKVRADLPSSHRLCGIGVGAPNAHYHRGTIEKAVNLNWGETIDFVELVRNSRRIFALALVVVFSSLMAM